jgi:hypothetical protein
MTNLMGAGYDAFMCAAKSELIYWTEKQVQEITGVKVRTLQSWRYQYHKTGVLRGPRWTEAERMVRYRSDWVHEWAESNAVEMPAHLPSDSPLPQKKGG